MTSTGVAMLSLLLCMGGWMLQGIMSWLTVEHDVVRQEMGHTVIIPRTPPDEPVSWPALGPGLFAAPAQVGVATHPGKLFPCPFSVHIFAGSLSRGCARRNHQGGSARGIRADKQRNGER